MCLWVHFLDPLLTSGWATLDLVIPPMLATTISTRYDYNNDIILHLLICFFFYRFSPSRTVTWTFSCTLTLPLVPLSFPFLSFTFTITYFHSFHILIKIYRKAIRSSPHPLFEVWWILGWYGLWSLQFEIPCWSSFCMLFYCLLLYYFIVKLWDGLI